jgi:ABC-2 type transport system permease protein
MRHFFILLRHEIHTMLVSPASYVASFLFLSLMGFIYWVNLRSFTQVESYDLPTTLFFETFWLPVFFLVPLLTMRSLAEERRQGTLETLLTTPAGAVAIVLSKFMAAYLFYLGIWLLTLAFPFLARMAVPSIDVQGQLLDRGSLMGGISFIALSGMLFIAVGIFSSSMTRSQLVAGMLSFTILFIIIVGQFLLLQQQFSEQPWLVWLDAPMQYLQTFEHLEDFSKGIIDTRPFFYYLSTAFLLLGLSVINVEAKA